MKRSPDAGAGRRSTAALREHVHGLRHALGDARSALERVQRLAGSDPEVHSTSPDVEVPLGVSADVSSGAGPAVDPAATAALALLRELLQAATDARRTTPAAAAWVRDTLATASAQPLLDAAIGQASAAATLAKLDEAAAAAARKDLQPLMELAVPASDVMVPPPPPGAPTGDGLGTPGPVLAESFELDADVAQAAQQTLALPDETAATSAVDAASAGSGAMTPSTDDTGELPEDDEAGFTVTELSAHELAVVLEGLWPSTLPGEECPSIPPQGPPPPDCPPVDAAAPIPPPVVRPAAEVGDVDVPAVAPAPPAGEGGSDDDDDDDGLEADLQEAEQLRAMLLRVVYRAGHTGFEQTKEFRAELGTLIAGRYRVSDLLGSAAFSSAYSCEDLATGDDVCLKVIKNNKDFVDQGLDEIKLLRALNAAMDATEGPEPGVLRLLDAFYHREHLMLVTELLKDNLYEFQKFLLESGEPPYFTLPRVQRIARQSLEALAFVHAQGVVHCDLKPENIVIQSYSRCDVKIIDFGSSCYTTDHLSSYIQSRSYRAPEVVLGLPYGPKIDVWSLGCILAELLTAEVLFHNDGVPSMLARMASVLGRMPARMLREGRDAPRYFTPQGLVVDTAAAGDDGGGALLFPRPSSLAAHVPGADDLFISFLQFLLRLDPRERPTAEEALRHPFLSADYPMEPYALPV